MSTNSPSSPTMKQDDPADEAKRLRDRLMVAEETLRAIRGNEVDAVVVDTGGVDRVYTLGGADESYRTFVEVMRQGAATIAMDGAILYCNRHFADLMRSPLPQ